MKRQRWYLALGIAFVITSATLYLIHFVIFRDPHHIFIYLMGDLAFLPLEVLVVTLIVDRLLSERDKRAALEKMNMVIGAFYSEVGTELLRRLCDADPEAEDKKEAFHVSGKWKEEDFHSAQQVLSTGEFKSMSRATDLADLRGLLVGERDFLVRLLENPILLEHATFSDLLWAVFHLTEELERRSNLEGLPDPDLDHLSGDMSRAYGLLARQWLEYMRHLEKNYPYLFSLALRLNPFDPDAQVEIT